jgi:hypothetical protein
MIPPYLLFQALDNTKVFSLGLCFLHEQVLPGCILNLLVKGIWLCVHGLKTYVKGHVLLVLLLLTGAMPTLLCL